MTEHFDLRKSLPLIFSDFTHSIKVSVLLHTRKHILRDLSLIALAFCVWEWVAHGLREAVPSSARPRLLLALTSCVVVFDSGGPGGCVGREAIDTSHCA